MEVSVKVTTKGTVPLAWLTLNDDSGSLPVLTRSGGVTPLTIAVM
jgi:hypothetical protein